LTLKLYVWVFLSKFQARFDQLFPNSIFFLRRGTIMRIFFVLALAVAVTKAAPRVTKIGKLTKDIALATKEIKAAQSRLAKSKRVLKIFQRQNTAAYSRMKIEKNSQAKLGYEFASLRVDKAIRDVNRAQSKVNGLGNKKRALMNKLKMVKADVAAYAKRRNDAVAKWTKARGGHIMNIEKLKKAAALAENEVKLVEVIGDKATKAGNMTAAKAAEKKVVALKKRKVEARKKLNNYVNFIVKKARAAKRNTRKLRAKAKREEKGARKAAGVAVQAEAEATKAQDAAEKARKWIDDIDIILRTQTAKIKFGFTAKNREDAKKYFIRVQKIKNARAESDEEIQRSAVTKTSIAKRLSNKAESTEIAAIKARRQADAKNTLARNLKRLVKEVKRGMKSRKRGGKRDGKRSGKRRGKRAGKRRGKRSSKRGRK
jgi:hypothetical protein